MKKIIISVVAIAAAATAAHAAERRSWDLRDADTYIGKYASSSAAVGSSSINALAVTGSESDGTLWLHSRNGVTRNPADVRRWDEKNG